MKTILYISFHLILPLSLIASILTGIAKTSLYKDLLFYLQQITGDYFFLFLSITIILFLFKIRLYLDNI